MSLTKKVYLTISGYDIKLSDNLKFYKNDQLKLIFYINEYGIDVKQNRNMRSLMPVNPLAAILFFETPEGVDSVESAMIEENAVTFYLSSKQTQYIGVSRMQIQLLDEDGCQVTLPPFEFEIRENIYDGEMQVVDVALYDSNTDALLVDENGNLIIVGKVKTDI